MDINKIIADYMQEKATEAAAKKRAEAMKKIIMQHAGDAERFVTDEYTVIVKKTTSKRLDTAALYKDFPDIKDVYEKATTSQSLVIAENAGAGKKSA